MSVRCQSNLVNVSRSNFYYKPIGESKENLKIMRLMDAYYPKHPT